MKDVDIALIWGTRPEHIKIYPVWKALKDKKLSTYTICTGQHKELIDTETFDIEADINLDLMRKNQSLSAILSKCLSSLDEILQYVKPRLVLVQGDTSSAYAGAMSSFYWGIPVGHIESGLRTFVPRDPFPEEMHRSLIRELATYHFVPTLFSIANLVKNNIKNNIYLTGNTVVDSLKKICLENDIKIPEESGKKVLITLHRRENDKNIDDIMNSLIDLANQNNTFEFIFPMHPRMKSLLGIINENVYIFKKNNISIIEPLNYIDFLKEMSTSYCVITDSGGVQEEASVFGVPCFVIRNTTERMESIGCYAAFLCGNTYWSIMEAFDNYFSECKRHNNNDLYGDGTAGIKIANIVESIVHENTGN